MNNENIINAKLFIEAAKFAKEGSYPRNEYSLQPYKLLKDTANLLESDDFSDLDKSPSKQIDQKQLEFLNFIQDNLKEFQSSGLIDEIPGKVFLAKMAEDFTNGRSDSDLTKYDYDMVVSVTLGALNAIMKKYIVDTEKPKLLKYYVMRVNKGREYLDEANEEEVYELSLLDLFSIPSDKDKRTVEQEKKLVKAFKKYNFRASFQGIIGFDDDITPYELDDILELNEGELDINQPTVKYKLFFSSLEILQLSGSSYDLDFVNFSQSPESPLVYDLDMNLNINSASDSDIPGEILDKLISFDPEATFDINQLCLDLQTMTLKSFPEIPLINQDVYNLFKSKFLKLYFDALNAKGNVTFSYMIAPMTMPEPEKKYVVCPQEYKLFVQKYIGENQGEIDKKKLATLNYILFSKGNTPPETFQPFAWNWIENKEEYAKHNGIISINQKHVYKVAYDLFPDFVSILLFKVKTWIEEKTFGNKFWYSFQHDPQPVVFDETYKHYKYKSESYYRLPGVFIDDESYISYTLLADILMYENKNGNVIIELVVDVEIYLDVTYYTNDKGKISHKKFYFTIEVEVDEYGCVVFKPSFSYQPINDTNFVGPALLDFSDVKSYLDEKLDKLKDYVRDSFLSSLDGFSSWVLPGDKTFIYSDPQLSKETAYTDSTGEHRGGLDLTFGLLYVDMLSKDD
jgi:hypothetical protein